MVKSHRRIGFQPLRWRRAALELPLVSAEGDCAFEVREPQAAAAAEPHPHQRNPATSILSVRGGGGEGDVAVTQLAPRRDAGTASSGRSPKFLREWVTAGGAAPRAGRADPRDDGGGGKGKEKHCCRQSTPLRSPPVRGRGGECASSGHWPVGHYPACACSVGAAGRRRRHRHRPVTLLCWQRSGCRGYNAHLHVVNLPPCHSRRRRVMAAPAPTHALATARANAAQCQRGYSWQLPGHSLAKSLPLLPFHKSFQRPSQWSSTAARTAAWAGPSGVAMQAVPAHAILRRHAVVLAPSPSPHRTLTVRQDESRTGDAGGGGTLLMFTAAVVRVAGGQLLWYSLRVLLEATMAVAVCNDRRRPCIEERWLHAYNARPAGRLSPRQSWWPSQMNSLHTAFPKNGAISQTGFQCLYISI